MCCFFSFLKKTKMKYVIIQETIDEFVKMKKKKTGNVKPTRRMGARGRRHLVNASGAVWVALIGCERELVLLSCETVIINSPISLGHVLVRAPPLPSATTKFNRAFSVIGDFSFSSSISDL